MPRRVAISQAEKLSRRCNFVAEQGLLVLGFSMAVIVIVQVFCRYILNYSLFWSEELARYLLVWLTFLGATVAYYRGMHPGVDFLYRRLPDSIKPYSRIVVHTVSLCFFSIMVFSGSQFTFFVRAQTTAALSLPKWIIFAVIPISGILLILHTSAMLLNEHNKLKNES